MSVFEQLNAINVNSKVEQKKTGKTSLSYLSWSWAWAEFKKVCPTATYAVSYTHLNKVILVFLICVSYVVVKRLFNFKFFV